MNNLLVSVIVPCYNQGKFLSDALKSILNQTYEYWECIIVDDGSLDSTPEVAKKWLNKDSRFKYIVKENGGLSSARNAGLEVAIGAFIQFLDADDIIDKNKFQFSIDLFKTNVGLNVVVSDFRMFTKSINKTSGPYCQLDQSLFTYENILFQWDDGFSVPIHCALFQKHLFKNFTFSEQLKSKEDWLMWICVFKQSNSVLFIKEPFAFYRKHNESMTMKKMESSDYFIAISIIKTLISIDDYVKLLEVLVERYFNKSQYLKLEMIKLKKHACFKILKYFKK